MTIPEDDLAVRDVAIRELMRLIRENSKQVERSLIYTSPLVALAVLKTLRTLIDAAMALMPSSVSVEESLNRR
jgi:hypothetical protein